MSARVYHFPAPQSLDQDEIDRGREGALQQYQVAKSDADRIKALIWVNHWRVLNERAKALRALGF